MVIATIITITDDANGYDISYFEKNTNQFLKRHKVKPKDTNTVNDLYFKAVITALKEAKTLEGDTIIIGMAYQTGVRQLNDKYVVNKSEHAEMIKEIKQLVKKVSMKVKFQYINIEMLKALNEKYS